MSRLASGHTCRSAIDSPTITLVGCIVVQKTLCKIILRVLQWKVHCGARTSGASYQYEK